MLFFSSGSPLQVYVLLRHAQPVMWALVIGLLPAAAEWPGRWPLLSVLAGFQADPGSVQREARLVVTSVFADL